jgi:hypothetical protein
MMLEIKNTFHNRSLTVRVSRKAFFGNSQGWEISRRTWRKIWKALCPHDGSGCACGAAMMPAVIDYDAQGEVHYFILEDA